MQNKKMVLVIIGGLIIVCLSFWGGVKYGQSKVNINSNFLSRFGGQFNSNQMMGKNDTNTIRNVRGGMGGGFISGEVLSMDDKSVTIKLNDGGSKIVFFSSTTKIEKTVDGLVSDIAIGKQVSIMGSTNTDGSVNATSIQIRPNTLIKNKIN